MYAEAEAHKSKPNCEIRPPTVADGAAIWRLVRESGVLDVNSCYAYLLLCRDFADTCRVALSKGEVIAFVTAYIPPRRPETLFVWQIGVSKSARRSGLATTLLRQVLHAPACRQVRCLEATVAPSNTASLRLFTRLAEELGVALRREAGFEGSDFGVPPPGEAPHEAEWRLRIGPLPTSHPSQEML